MKRDEADKLIGSLFDCWYTPLVRHALRLSMSLELAEDTVQECFIELYGELLRGRPIENPEGWMVTVVRREICRRQRDRDRRDRRFRPLDEAQDGPQAPLPAEEDERLSGLLSVLTAREQEVLLLRVKAFKYKEIAATLGISTNSIKTLLARALKKLRQASAPGSYAEPVVMCDETALRKTLH